MTRSDATTVTVQRDVPFQEVGDEVLHLDLYEATATNGPKPMAVLVRGGGFAVGDKGEFARHAIDLAEAGYLVVEPQYRLAPAWTFPAPLVDVKAAVEWCRAEGEAYGGDPTRVVAAGHSAGANLVVLAAATADDPAFEPDLYPGTSSALSAVAGYAGVYDFRAFARLDETEHDVDTHAQYLGGTPGEVPEAYELASPVAQADVSMPSTLLLHGRDDAVIPPQQTALMAEALGPLTAVEHDVVPGGHAFPFNGAFYDDVYERTVRFFDQHAGAGPGSDAGHGVSGPPDGGSTPR
ncbi:alpha/beta hydrolase fold domain-containing protein [Halomicroarcula sp. GCM10025817]|uniref:alpha/beta hydrolase fold domain-containing protein n=2 Tax=Haloarcula TaxID=2237 RepID=UPI00360E5D43